MPRNAVVDTSVLVSAFLFPHSMPGRVVALANDGAFALHLSPIILEELGRSLRNPRLRRSYPYSDGVCRSMETSSRPGDVSTRFPVM
jgi:predicted nucleic acid-binding protein